MLTDYGITPEQYGDDKQYFYSLNPEGLSVHFLHSLEEDAFEIGVHTTLPRMAVRSVFDFVIKNNLAHLEMIPVIEALLSQDLERIRCSGLEQDLLASKIKNQSINIAVFASSLHKGLSDFSAAVRAMSERVYGVECVAPQHLVYAFSRAEALAAEMSDASQAAKTRH